MIGIFDSGLGGLTVVKAVMQQLPGYDLVYFGDTARTPYGPKSASTVTGYAMENTNFLLRKGARIIVVACNSAASVATEKLRAEFDVPIFEVVTPAVEMAVNVSARKHIGIIGTRATINSGVYAQQIQEKSPNAKIYSVACPLLVPLVEEGWLKKPETRMIVKKYLLPLKMRKVDTLILGCTHYPLLKSIIQVKIGKRVAIIDSSIAVADAIKRYLDSNPDVEATLGKNNHSRFFVSDITQHFKSIAQSVLKRSVELTHIAL